MRTLTQLMAALALCVTAAAGFAHQQKTAISTVLFNPSSQNIEVMHRFYVHDAEHAVKQIFGKQADILNSRDSQQLFGQYVAERFAIFTADDQPVDLSLVGFELEGRFFWVYQETSLIDDLQGLRVKHDALRDIWSSQTNTVNVERLGDIQTLTFDHSVEVLNVSFEGS